MLNWLLDPPEVKPVSKDWQGGDIYKGDSIYIIESDIVLKDDLENYIETLHGKAQEA